MVSTASFTRTLQMVAAIAAPPLLAFDGEELREVGEGIEREHSMLAHIL